MKSVTATEFIHNLNQYTKFMDALTPCKAPTTNLHFSHALAELKDGKKLQRAGWNGKGMYIYYVPEQSYPAVTAIAKAEFGEMVPYGAYLAMKTAQNNVVPWLASQTDILANDWQIID